MSNTEPHPVDSDQVEELTNELIKIHREMNRLESESLSGDRLLEATHLHSARNLIHYLALRRHDIRRLQESLTSLGLSSLGRSEAHIKLAVEILVVLLHRCRAGLYGRRCNLKSGNRSQSGGVCSKSTRSTS